MGRSRSLDKDGFRGSRRPVHRALALVGAVVVGAAILIPGGSATPSNAFSAVFTPASVQGGVLASLQLTITNVSSGPKLDSADVTLPGGFTLTDGSTTSVHLGQLNLAQGASTSRNIDVHTACTPGSGSTYSWQIGAQNKNGDNLTIDTQSSDLTTDVSATSCKYKFSAQPRDAEVGTTITSAIFNPSGAPVKVGVIKETGELDPTASGSVSLTASKNPADFSGNGAPPNPVSLVAGEATFPNLTSSKTGQFVTLTASGSSYQAAVSGIFNILAEVNTCAPPSCKAQQSSQGDNGKTTVDANASGFVQGDVLAATVYPAVDFSPPTNCGGTTTWTPLSGASGAQVEYAPTSGSTGWTITITITIDKSLIVDPSKGAAQYDVCLGAKKVSQASCTDAPSGGFKTKSGATATCDSATGLYWGLLPDCPNGNKKPPLGPCVKSKTKDNAGDLIFTAVKQSPWDGNFHT
jgi:hypothetical protein